MSGQGSASERQSSRQGSASDMQSSPQATSTQNQSARQSTATQAQSSRQAYGSDAREGWQDYSDDYHRGAAPYYSAAVVGTAVVAGTAAVGGGYAAGAAGPFYSAPPCTPTTAVVGGVTYYICGGSSTFRSVIGVRCETSPEQLRYLLVKIREMLLCYPRIDPDSVRTPFVGFGASSLDIEVFAYVTTTDMAEFLGIREDVFLRFMDIVAQSGTGFAFPSQTPYFTGDDGLNAERTEVAEAQVRQWRDEGRLPFPNFSTEQIRQMRGSMANPPPGSPDASNAGLEKDTKEG